MYLYLMQSSDGVDTNFGNEGEIAVWIVANLLMYSGTRARWEQASAGWILLSQAKCHKLTRSEHYKNGDLEGNSQSLVGYQRQEEVR